MIAAGEAEQSVISQILGAPAKIGDLLGTQLHGDDFGDPACALIYDHLVESFYADDTTDVLTVATLLGPRLARLWNLDQPAVVARLQGAAARMASGTVQDHGLLVRRAADERRLLQLSRSIVSTLEAGEHRPDEIAAQISTDAMKIATGAMTTSDIVPFADAGRIYVGEVKGLVAANRSGQKVGVYTGINAIDDFTAGLKPTEFMVHAGAPGVGKSGVMWRSALNFAEAQSLRPKDRQVATLIMSLEMGRHPSSGRVAQMLTGIQSRALRSGGLTNHELQHIVDEWAAKKDIPLYFNYTPSVRSSQLRALVAEAVRKHNVGFVVIDHFRSFRMDQPPRSPIDHDEEKALFLKEQIANDLNVAVVCIAHSRKAGERSSERPTLDDLRGSGQIAANADFVNFLHRPGLHDDEADPTAAEIVWAKNRHGDQGVSEFFFSPETMVAV